ncbi:hypothetical protein [Halomicrococcus sp. SG-WS-1]|uniref:hypothetical protein n=1 Tax=Halomicrococcus sp. SG-WS-1 TaxID=3439057 RepID=UPI003F7935F9
MGGRRRSPAVALGESRPERDEQRGPGGARSAKPAVVSAPATFESAGTAVAQNASTPRFTLATPAQESAWELAATAAGRSPSRSSTAPTTLRSPTVRYSPAATKNGSVRVRILPSL